MLGYDYHLFFSMPSAPAWSSIPCLFPLFVSSLQARQRSGTLALTPGLFGLSRYAFFRVVDKETFGSPKFPGYPLELMPCSSTPVVTSVLALAHSGLLPSASMTALAFPPMFRRLSLVTFFFTCPRLYKFRGSIPKKRGTLSHGLFSCSPGFRLPLPGLPARFATALLARL